MKVSVSILNKQNDLVNTIKKINNSKASFIHIDVLDNTYIDIKSFDISDFIDIEKVKKIDVHLMSNDVIKRVDEYKKISPEYIIFHYEVGNTLEYINYIKKNNIKVGLAINPETKIDDIKEYLNYIDLILVMGVNPGKSGQKYIDKVDEKIKLLYKLKKDYNFLISVDGGINDITIKNIRDYIDIAVSGSYITNSDNYDNQIDKLIGE